MKLFLNSIIVFSISLLYASFYWLGEANWWLMERMVSVGAIKPYVYRQLIPILARFLSEFGIRVDWALCILVALCGVGFYLSTRAIALHYNDTLSNLEELSIFGLCLLGLGLFGQLRLHYDLSTAFLFSLSLLFIIRGDIVKYLMVFPVAVLNRETSALLIVIFAMYFGLKYLEILYQICAFGSVQGIIRLVFWNNWGESVMIEPVENFYRFLANPDRALAHGIVFLVFVVVCLYRWNKMGLEKWVFVFLGSMLSVMYFVLGQAFEVRVFWEAYPITVVLFTQTLKEIYNEKIQQTTQDQKVHGLQPTQDRI